MAAVGFVLSPLGLVDLDRGEVGDETVRHRRSDAVLRVDRGQHRGVQNHGLVQAGLDAPGERRGLGSVQVSGRDEQRRDAPFTWISSQRGRSARAGRRHWADLRGPMLAAAAIAAGGEADGTSGRGLAMAALSGMEVSACAFALVAAVAQG